MVIRVEKEILVIGTGGAGLRAAIEADSMGAGVSLVSKAPAGMNNATVVAGGGFRAAIRGLTPEEHREDTLRVGKGLNDPELLEVFTEEGGSRVLELKKFGVDMTKREGGISVGEIPTLRGFGLTKPLVEYLNKKGVEIFENTIITKIIRNDGKVTGAIGYHVRSDEPVIFHSKAVILATGGAGGIYRRTDCPLRTTGDGYSLAYHSGARLRDMEFVQFYPVALAEPDTPPFLLGQPLTEEGSIINRLGEDIPEKYGLRDRPLILKSRDLLSRAIMEEIIDGNGVDEAVLLDVRKVFQKFSREEIASHLSHRVFINEINAQEKPMRVAPICHFCMGGIEININGETGIPGLYGCGEATGGLHGANRHGGNALTSITVFGARTGAAASKYVKEEEYQSMGDSPQKEMARYEEILHRRNGFNPHQLRETLEEEMWKNAGVVRDANSLGEALKNIQSLRERCENIITEPGREMLVSLELPMAIDTAEMIIRGAIKREESRGAHYRSDYPREDPNWKKTIIINKGEDKTMKLTSRPLKS
jgi:succinate dehydrogenase/fumarate reductase flavoprotein subunit